ncbi:antibiotic biosynthesis monooxygenase [Sulfitobacter albidus]|uniref:Antibiotic biosynthesis monooxygenase n=1 Tax=Sulfitobacter albidus TaxID=2829501 RepID=A0A975PM93_9RHOB|nr:putative quinol monooxygenase [Sulfitobacter albidus]QUJ75995.1 antibiotic biosynthesis monooxygenase [Sulfitobacter albidus]
MFAVVVSLEVKPGTMATFLPAMTENARLSLACEPGCHRFDVCTDSARPDEVFLYELYTDRAAFDAHLETAHFRAFDAKSGAWIVAKDVRTFDGVNA